MRAKLAVVIFVLSVTPAVGQTASEIELKYGRPIPVYSVSEHIWMTPEYATDGQVCRMRLYPKHLNDNVNYVGATLPYKELRDLLNSLVPPDKRGSKIRLNFGATATGGPAAWTTYGYERVTFTFTGSLGKSTETQLLRRGEFVFSVPATDPVAPAESLTPSVDDFSPSESTKTEIVIIQWNDRKCLR